MTKHPHKYVYEELSIKRSLKIKVENHKLYVLKLYKQMSLDNKTKEVYNENDSTKFFKRGQISSLFITKKRRIKVKNGK